MTRRSIFARAVGALAAGLGIKAKAEHPITLPDGSWAAVWHPLAHRQRMQAMQVMLDGMPSYAGPLDENGFIVLPRHFVSSTKPASDFVLQTKP